MNTQISILEARHKGSASRQLLEKEIERLFPARLIQRILLVAPPDVDVDLFNYAAAKRGRCWNYPPYGLGLLARHLLDSGLSVHILNLNHEVLKACRGSASADDFDFDRTWKTALAKEIADFQPEIIGVTCMFTQTHGSAVKLCREVKRLNPALPVAIGGVHITTCFLEDKASELLVKDFQAADLFFLYEAELAFKQFIAAVNRRAPLEKLCQLYFNSGAQNFYFPAKRIPAEKEIDVIPMHELMRPQELMDYGVVGSFFCLKEKGTRITTVLANRGCRGQCTYCSVKSFNGPGVRHRSWQSIIKELEFLRDKYNIRHIMWLDDDLFHDHARALELFHQMAKRKLGVTWDCTNGVIALSCTDELIAAAEESGCIGLTIGVESGNPGIIKEMKKPGSVQVFRKAAQVLKKHPSINTRVFLMIGFLRETFRMILDTFNLAQEMGLDWYNITIFEPLPNTPIFQAMKKEVAQEQFKFENIRYNVGPYGKLRQKLNSSAALPKGGDPFFGVDLDAVPSREHLDDLWFYMNFHLNFKRLSNENNPLKLNQQLRYLENITTLIAPDDPFPMYFCGYLQNRLLSNIDGQLIRRLEDCLSRSEYWRKKFTQFALSVEDLKTKDFPFS